MIISFFHSISKHYKEFTGSLHKADQFGMSGVNLVISLLYK
jgi:hypothetical protein